MNAGKHKVEHKMKFKVQERRITKAKKILLKKRNA
jgi:hypothetical protein